MILRIQNPHDKFFKETFSNLEVVKDFILNYLPPTLVNLMDLDTIQPQKDSFINEELKEQFSDMLFQLNINQHKGIPLEVGNLSEEQLNTELKKGLDDLSEGNLPQRNMLLNEFNGIIMYN